ncbi:MAG: alpha/beta hydrolase [Patescibacteria group bacterium]|nr:alpha/beta hydrolase [Patescibacteria group bacterium]
MNVFIFHGTLGSPEGNWFPWLERELKSLGVEVYVPRFPTPEGQNLDNWLKAFEKYEKKITQNTVFVGHSMGPGFFLRWLERGGGPIKAAILAAPFDDLIGIESFDKLNKSFVDHPFNWEKIKQNCQKFIVFAGDDDPYVPIKFPQRIADNLGVELRIIRGGQHLGETLKEFPAILKEIKRLK